MSGPGSQVSRGGLRLDDLVREVPGAVLVSGDGSIRVEGVHHDSRRVAPGDLFVARAGAAADGERFIGEAIARGARAVLVRRGSAVDTGEAPRLEADDVPRALSFAAAAVHGHPTFSLEVVGITGTNGKTTTAHLVRACIDGAGGRAGIVGTLGHRFADLDLVASHTSPEADELSRVAAAMRDRGATHLVMEVSSIALAASRVEAVRFKVAAFTNLTQDHLDYHGTMERYAEAKARLFTELGPGAAVVNVDDDFGRELAARLGGAGKKAAPAPRLLRVSAAPGAGLDDADVAPVRLAHAPSGIRMRARTPAGEVDVASPLVGAHNASNLLVALAVAVALGLDVGAAADALSRFIDIPGRLERCDDPSVDDVVALVDYAHTPDALARVLDGVRSLGEGELVCVFGCGGDRDAGKRPLMGQAVGARADVAFVTSDNPRGEDPRVIAEAILPGIEARRARVVLELDRARAIARAILEAAPGSVVVVAGKGHETYQLVGAATLSFDDREHTRRALAARRAARGARS